MDCKHKNHNDGTRNLFCECGKLKVPGSLAGVRIEPRFTGGASLNPKIEQFWASGDPNALL